MKLDKESDFKTCDMLFLSSHNIHCLDEIYKKIEHTYSKLKFKNQVLDFLEATLIKIDNFDLNSICMHQLKYLCKKLSINTDIISESKFLTKDKIKSLGASKRLLYHAQHTKAKVYITGINSVNYLDTTIFQQNDIQHMIHKFDYSIFQNLQKCSDPLSIVHQIAHLGLEKISDLLNETQVNKNKILNSL